MGIKEASISIFWFVNDQCWSAVNPQGVYCFGALDSFVYFGYLASRFFKDNWLFPITLIGLKP
jgi:hypothetical protein